MVVVVLGIVVEVVEVVVLEVVVVPHPSSVNPSQSLSTESPQTSAGLLVRHSQLEPS
jgi:hypothetical protein